MRKGLSCLIVTLGLAVSASAETRVEKTLKIDSGGRLEVDTEMGSITVTGTSRSDVNVVVTSKSRDLDDLLTLRFEDGGKTARITGRRKGGHLFNWSDGSSRVHFEIEVPMSTASKLDTSGGGVIVASIHAEVRLHSSGGSLDVRDVVGEVDGHTSGGGVRLKNIKGKVRVETSGGSIDGSDLDGPVEGDTSGGGITMTRRLGRRRHLGRRHPRLLRARQLAGRPARVLGRLDPSVARSEGRPRDRRLGRQGHDRLAAPGARRDLPPSDPGHPGQGRPKAADPHERRRHPHRSDLNLRVIGAPRPRHPTPSRP